MMKIKRPAFTYSPAFAKLCPANLLSVDTNPKTVKGASLGVRTAILYLAPHTVSGRQTCPMAAIAQCDKACLNKAGLGGVYNSIQLSRIHRTNLFFDHRADFMRKLAQEIMKFKAKAALDGVIPVVRLNGTSDIKWECIPVTIDGIEHPSLMHAFPDLQFYDYTKLPNRRDLPSNYDLTFSYSGVLGFQKYVEQARAAGMRIAVVFRDAKKIPVRFMGMQVVNGDNSDVRHFEPQGVVVALYAKGPAKKDITGFVVDGSRSPIMVGVSAAPQYLTAAC
jgi:hypothetical protein